MSTVLDIIKGSFRLINVLGSGEALPNEYAQDAKAALNQMLDAWSLEKLNVYTVTSTLFNAVAGTANYTIGTAQTWNAARPIKIDGAFARLNGNDYPCEIIHSREYDEIADKTETSEVPRYLYYKPNYPYGVVYLWPVPSENIQINLTTWTKLSSYTSLTDSINLPEGYDIAIKYNLALELAGEFNVTPSQIVYNKATEYKAALKALHIEPIILKNEVSKLSSTGTFNIYTGE